ncbi:hypothetical protein GCM10022268_25300 [Sphingomonas cynarae]|uniref:Uncharacterized protein n=1 Tax=Sphingomonas cynarae TaxID=930197 RepID=A0ABP7E9Z2_9SPHN
MTKKRSDLAASLEARVPFDVSKPMFELQDVARGRGWSGTVEKLTEERSLPGKKADALLEALKEHELSGEKLCRFYRVDEAIIKAMNGKLTGTKASKGAMQDAYPFLLDEAELKKLPLGQPVLLSVDQVGGGLAAVFGSVRALRVREPVDPKSFPDGADNILANYDEVIGLKLVRHQAVDVIWLPDSGDVIDLRVDYPRGTHADIGRASQNSAMAAFNKLVGTDPFGTPLNLFPLLSKMYDADDEGRVVELAFGTTTRSIKHERMRVSVDCLRTELYHMGGKKSLKTPVRPYKVSIAYTVDLGGGVESHPELNLHTTSYVAENPNPQLYDAVVRKTVGLTDYDHVRQRLLHFSK